MVNFYLESEKERKKYTIPFTEWTVHVFNSKPECERAFMSARYFIWLPLPVLRWWLLLAHILSHCLVPLIIFPEQWKKCCRHISLYCIGVIERKKVKKAFFLFLHPKTSVFSVLQTNKKLHRCQLWYIFFVYNRVGDDEHNDCIYCDYKKSNTVFSIFLNNLNCACWRWL